MINSSEILQTVQMFNQQHLDIRTITMGISLLDCADPDPRGRLRRRSTTRSAAGQRIWWPPARPSRRSSASPSSTSASPSRPSPWWPLPATPTDYVPFADALDRAAKTVGVNFIGGYLGPGAEGLHRRRTEQLIALHPGGAGRHGTGVLVSVNVGSTKAGINMDAVADDGPDHQGNRRRAPRDRDGLGCAKLVVFCNAVEDNPFMAGAFHGVGRGRTCVINVGVSGPGVVHHALQSRARDSPSTWWPRPSKRPPSSITRMGQLVAQEACRRGWTCPSASWTCPWRPRPAIGDSRGPHPGGDGPGGLRHPRHHRRAGPAQRRGEKGRRHGLRPRGRPVRRLHPRVSEDEGMIAAAQRGTLTPGQAGSHDLRVLRGAGHDRRPRATPPRRPSPPSSPTRPPSAWSTPRPPPCASSPPPARPWATRWSLAACWAAAPVIPVHPFSSAAFIAAGRADPCPHAEFEKLRGRRPMGGHRSAQRCGHSAVSNPIYLP